MIQVSGNVWLFAEYCLPLWQNSDEDEEANSDDDVPCGSFVNLNIDAAIYGVGGADTWGKRTLPQNTVPANQPYHYGFILYI
jgi:beta-galactosidase